MKRETLEKLLDEDSTNIFSGQSRNGKSLTSKEKWGIFLYWAGCRIPSEQHELAIETASDTISKTIKHCIEVSMVHTSLCDFYQTKAFWEKLHTPK